MDGSTFLASISALRKADPPVGVSAVGDSRMASRLKPEKEATRIQFNGEIDTFPIRGHPQVTIAPFSRGEHNMGSSQLQMRTLVNYAWDKAYYPGRLVAVDLTGRFLAYAIVVKPLASSSGDGLVRVVKRKGLAGIDQVQRVLLKGMKGQIKDVDFAHCRDESSRSLTVGCVDETGQVFVFLVAESLAGDLSHSLILQINPDPARTPTDHHRFIWCPYLPEEDDVDDSTAKLFVVVHGNEAEMCDSNTIIHAYGPGPHVASDLKDGRLVVKDHGGQAIMDAAFSPDGTALATASSDGEVCFFQVYMHGSESPRCLHQWSPHEGQALSGLFFLDDHKHYDPGVQFWKYLVTTCEHHSELKIWSCESWTCLQTIQFLKDDNGVAQRFKATLDLTGNYLVLSDLGRRNLYVLKFKELNGTMACVSASEFATPAPFLSMSIIDAGQRKITVGHSISDDEHDSDDEDFDDQNEKITKEVTIIDLVLVQPKSLQTCRITFEEPILGTAIPEGIKFEPFDEEAVIPKAEISIPDIKPDISLLQASIKAEAITSPLAATGMADAKPIEPPMTLMSPDAFATHSTASKVVKVKEEIIVDEILEDEIPLSTERLAVSSQALRNSLFRSVNSSPSREVQDILDESEKNVKLSQSFDTAFTGSSRTNTMAPLASDQSAVMLQKMNEMMSLIQSQKDEMNRLQERVRIAQQGNKKEVETLINQSNKKLMDAIKKEHSKRHDDVSAQWSKSLNSKLETVVRAELKKTSTHMIHQISQQIQDSLQVDLSQRSVKSDLALKDAVGKMVQSRPVCDNIGQSVANSITPFLQTAFRNAFTHVIVPSFEKSIQAMMVQISSTFMKGVKEHETQLNAHMAKLREEQHQGVVEPLVKELRGALGNVDHIVTSVQRAVASEVNEAFAQSPLRSQSATPSITGSANNPGNSLVDTQRTIQGHLAQGRINEAFQTALSASNLGVVMLTCEMVNPMQIFAQSPCPLSQHVLLALIQQLGHNLEEKTELKHKYLEEAVMNLDPVNIDTKAHLSGIMSGLCKQLKTYISRHPNQKMTKQMRLLLMAAQHLVGK
ncbi:hypothetical protein TCAL_06947 [Tigriopus californicus]|uniref:Uncharacterized protein n=1 Tax=Tigriopus californicus TaxID=6832 RepID=A0A553PHW9_TIGCA|nr:hypothetical protein TCAL_06947 [Tigriopus californicus]